MKNKNKRRNLAALLDDPYLKPYKEKILERAQRVSSLEHRLTEGKKTLAGFACAHEFFGLHFRNNRWVFREWAPNATDISLVGDFSGWQEKPEFKLKQTEQPGVWQISLPGNTMCHGSLYRLKIHWNGGSGDRIPAYARRVVQDDNTKIFNAQAWKPGKPFAWKNKTPISDAAPLIYEAHVGMAQEKPGVGTYNEFREFILPKIADAGYNTIQLMAIMEHPYYGSFGYHVSSFFAASSRFGTPEELKALIDAAHASGLRIIIDLIHSHAVKNEVEGLSCFDGTEHQYFHAGPRGFHNAWDSRCFDYSKPEVLHFLLSNCRFWLDEYKIDGFRFDGITSMLYTHHGLGPSFTNYDMYFNDSVDLDAIAYLTLANKLIHTLRPDATTIAEDVSGMPGLAAPVEQGGCGFDYRLAMGVPDCWFKLLNEVSDENWDINWLWHELTNRRQDEKTISYAECHDQAIVGGKTIVFELMDKEIYDHMRVDDDNLVVSRGMALHKMIRLATIATGGHGYLNFMGNEFGHPEWIDFPRAGNNWSYHYARRQWHLRYDPDLKYHYLAEFDTAMIGAISKHRLLEEHETMLLLNDNSRKLTIFKRGMLLFFFNFHPSESQNGLTIEAMPGKYSHILDTDEERFGGYGRITPGQNYFTTPVNERNAVRNFLSVYLPCRTALVIRFNQPES